MSTREKLYWFLGLITLLRIFVGSSFELSMDESYYWQWAKNLRLSYYDHPPMVALVIALTTIFSDGEIFIRLSAILSAVVASLILFRFTKELYGDEEAGLRAVWITNLTLIFCAGALVPTPDTPLIPFYAGGVLGFWMATKGDPDEGGAYGRWIIAGALIGCALLSKYTAFFFYPCAFLYLLLSSKNRGWLLKPHPYVAALTSFLFFTPVIIWNSQNNWVSLSFQAGHGLSGKGSLNFDMFAEFIGSQVLFYSIGLFFFLCVAFIAICKNGFAKGVDKKVKEASLFLFSFSFPILLFFTLNSFRARMEGNWPVLGFIPLFIQAGLMADGWRARKFVGKAWAASLLIAVLLFAFLHIQLVNPVIPHPQRHEISRRIFGWELLGKKVDKARAENSAAFLIANRHQMVGLMAYYTNPHMVAYVLDGNKQRYFFLPATESQKGKNAIYITEEERDQIGRVGKMFERVEKVERIVIERKGELIRIFIIYRCYNYGNGLK